MSPFTPHTLAYLHSVVSDESICLEHSLRVSLVTPHTLAYLHGVDDGEPICLLCSRVHDPEVVPLRVLTGIEIIPQPQFILKFLSEKKGIRR